MRRRSSSTHGAAAAFAAWLVTTAATSPSPAMASPILRIELENFDQMQFFGKVSVGAPPQEFRVIFDTGSSDVWLADQHCASCATYARRYIASQSSTFSPTLDSFRLEYGSGIATGVLMRETLRLGGALEIANVQTGRVNTTTQRLRHFHADGIVGLGLESLAVITKPGLFTTGASTLLSIFSIYINPLPSSSPPSQLILGGVDPALAQMVSPDDSPQWHYFPLIPYPETKRLGFWAVRMHDMKVHTGPIDLISNGVDASGRIAVAGNVTAIVDSGTSLLLLPPRVFNLTIAAITTHLQRVHNVLLAANSAAISGFACTDCSPHMFPTLGFTIESTAFHLQGVDYVRCDGAYCSPQLDSHTLFNTAPTAASTHEDQVIVLGAIFLRAYYTVFDAQHQRVGFACARDGCTGGRLSELRFTGDGLGGRAARMRFWRRVFFAVGAILLLVAAALLWQLLMALPSLHLDHPQTRRRKSINGDCHGVSLEESEPEDEPSLSVMMEDSSSGASRNGSCFGIEFCRRLSSTLATIVVVASASDSEESAREPVYATFRDNGANVPLLVCGPAANTQSERKRSGDHNDRSVQKTKEKRPELTLTAKNPEPLIQATTRFRKGSVCLEA